MFNARVGCFVEDQQGNVYALTNEHVTKYSLNSCFTFKDFNGIKHIFGESFNSRLRHEDKDNMDIALIKVKTEISDLCCNSCLDPLAKSRSCTIYTGPMSNIYGKEVFKCVPDVTISEFSDGELTNGIVLPENVHIKNKTELGLNKFLIKGGNGPFSIEGESGTVIAFSGDNGTIELVGIIQGGFGLSNSSETQTVCITLHSGLEALQTRYDKKMKLCTHKRQSKNIQEHQLQCGTIIYFDLKTNVNNNILESISTISCFAVTDAKKDELIPVLENEIKIRSLVSKMKTCPVSAYSLDPKELHVMNNIFSAGYSLVGNRFVEAEDCLKSACKILKDVPNCYKLTLLCNFINFAMWFFIESESVDNDKLARPLRDGLKFMEEYIEFSSFPKECIAFHYIDISRFFRKKGNTSSAIRHAKKSVEYFENIDRECQTSKSATRYILAIFQYARVLRQRKGHTSELKECFRLIETRLKGVQVVRNASLLLEICTSHFQEGTGTDETFTHAAMCLQKTKIASSDLATRCIQPWGACENNYS